MESLKIHHCTVIEKIFIILVLLFYCLFCRKGLAWPQNAFEATLTFDRIDSDCKVEEIKQNKIKFGFDNNCEIIYSPPPLPGSVKYCLKAFIDPSHTTVDGDKLNYNPEYGVEWYKAILPYPEQSACWGIKVLFEDPDGPEPASIKLTWDPNELKGEQFELFHGNCASFGKIIDMREENEIELQNIANGEIIRIRYSNTDCSSSPLIAIVSVGGDREEGRKLGRFDAFHTVSTYVYKYLFENSAIASSAKRRIRKEKIRYIFYHEHDLLFDDCIYGHEQDLLSDENILYLLNHEHDPMFDDCDDYDEIDFNPKKQKERLRNSITLWPVEKWSHCVPDFPTLFIYIIDHGVPKNNEVPSYICIDPTVDPNHNDSKLYASELDEWLNILENNLQSNDICDYEIFTFIEACHSNDFLDELWHPDPNNPQNSFFPKRIFLTTAEAWGAMYSWHSFSWDFWNNLYSTTDLSEAFEYADDNFKDQNAQIKYDKSNYNKMSEFYLNKHIYGSNLPVPYISEINSDVIDPNNPILYKPSFLTFFIDIDPKFSIEEIFAVIVPPGCSDTSCRKYIRDHKDMRNPLLDLGGNKYVFQPDYYFWSSGRYEIDFYVKEENTMISAPKIYFFDVNITDFKDNYEPDNCLDNATIFSENFQIHSFHDQNDIDWVKFPAHSGLSYEICLKPYYGLTRDPNLRPFQLTLFTVNERKGKVLDLIIEDDYSCCAGWKNINNDPVFAYLKIVPNINYQGFLPYKLTIQNANAGTPIFIIGEVDKNHRSIIEDLYLKDNDNQKYDPFWFLDIFESNYFIFNECIANLSPPLHLWLSDIDLGPIYIESTYINLEKITIDPNHSDLPCIKDNDCDGIIIDDPNPNHLDIILDKGLNLFRYPLWKPEGSANLYNIFFYDPNVISPNDPNTIKGIYIYSNQKGEWIYYDSNSSEIPLFNKSGCLIYLDSENKLERPLTSASHLNDPDNKEWGTCINDLDPNNLPVYSKINLYKGLNVVSFTGYRVYSVISPDPNYPDLDYPEICYDFWIPAEGGLNSYSVINSLSESDSYNQSNDPNFTVLRYDNHSGKWENSYSFFGRESGKQFKIKMNEAYLIYSKEEKVEWLPEHKLYKSH